MSSKELQDLHMRKVPISFSSPNHPEHGPYPYLDLSSTVQDIAYEGDIYCFPPITRGFQVATASLPDSLNDPLMVISDGISYENYSKHCESDFTRGVIPVSDLQSNSLPHEQFSKGAAASISAPYNACRSTRPYKFTINDFRESLKSGRFKTQDWEEDSKMHPLSAIAPKLPIGALKSLAQQDLGRNAELQSFELLGTDLHEKRAGSEGNSSQVDSLHSDSKLDSASGSMYEQSVAVLRGLLERMSTCFSTIRTAFVDMWTGTTVEGPTKDPMNEATLEDGLDHGANHATGEDETERSFALGMAINYLNKAALNSELTAGDIAHIIDGTVLSDTRLLPENDRQQFLHAVRHFAISRMLGHQEKQDDMTRWTSAHMLSTSKEGLPIYLTDVHAVRAGVDLDRQDIHVHVVEDYA